MTKKQSWLIAGAILLVYLVAHVAGLKSSGLTDDDDFYIPAGKTYAAWMGRAVTFQKGAWSRAGIDAAFNPNHEHPPIAKYVFGISDAAFGGLLGPYDGARMGTVLFSTLAAALLLWLCLLHFGPRRGLWIGGLSVLFLLLLPRFYFHSHAATLDVPVAAMYLLASGLALRGERSVKAAILAGPAFGLASATKLNAPFLIIPYLLFVLLTRRRRGASRRSLTLPPMPIAMLSMIVLGPLVFFAVWPWMWFDTVARVQQYVAFHLNHYGIYFLYFGRIFHQSPYAPWHAPILMAAATIPLATSALAALGLLFGTKQIVVRIKRRDTPDDDDRRAGDLLLSAVLHALVSVLVVCFSGGPKYGGAKLFMPFFPFWCLLAGYGSVRLWEYARRHQLRSWIPAAAVGLALVSALAQQVKFGAYALSQYNGLVGGLRGATALGFERQYYDIAFRDLTEWLNENAPERARVHFLPNNWEYVRTYRHYKKDGQVRRDLQVVQSEGSAQLLVITHERRFKRYGNDLMRHRQKPVLKERIVDGVPIWTVLKLR